MATDTPAEHSKEATRELAETIRDLLKEEEDIDAYDKIKVVGDSCVVTVTDEDDREYNVTIAPVKD